MLAVPISPEGVTHDSQIVPTQFCKELLLQNEFVGILTAKDLEDLRDLLYKSLEIRPYNETTMKAEEAIRWRRTGSQILEDGYVYEGKACTDIVVAFITLAIASGIEDTRFVKLKDKRRHRVHSVGEFRLPNGWYIYDVANTNAVPIQGEIQPGVPFGSYLLWKKGRDSWDLGLTEFNTISSIQV